MNTEPLIFRTLLPKTLMALIRLSWCNLRQALNTMLLILTRPLQYPFFYRAGTFSTPYTMLALVLVSAIIKFSFDPNATSVMKLLGFSSSVISMLFPVVVVGSAVVTVIGAYYIPRFWHWALTIPIEQSYFIEAMILTFASVSVLIDCTSPSWLPMVESGAIPVYVPDTVKTIIVTVYSWLVGKGIVQHQSLLQETHH